MEKLKRQDFNSMLLRIVMEYDDKVHLAGFDLPLEERGRLQTNIEHYLKKIQEHVDFDVLELTLKKSAKGKAFNHEVHGRLKAKGKVLSAEVSDYNVFKAVSFALDKILHEAEHLRRTSRQA